MVPVEFSSLIESGTQARKANNTLKIESVMNTEVNSRHI